MVMAMVMAVTILTSLSLSPPPFYQSFSSNHFLAIACTCGGWDTLRLLRSTFTNAIVSLCSSFASSLLFFFFVSFFLNFDCGVYQYLGDDNEAFIFLTRDFFSIWHSRSVSRNLSSLFLISSSFFFFSHFFFTFHLLGCIYFLIDI